MEVTSNVAVAADSHVFLIGRPPVGELLGFMRTMAVDGNGLDLGAVTAEWRVANDYVRTLERDEPALADNPTSESLPRELSTLAAEVMDDPVYKTAYRFVPSEIRLVDLDRVVVFQKYINLSHVDDLKRRLGPQPSAEEVFRFALPLEPQLPKVQMMQNSQNTFTFVSVSNDFRFLEAELVPSNIVSILRSTGRPVAVLGLAVGFGSNFMNVVHAENRLVLANGSHRAYALRALGIQKVPCLIQRVTRREELDLIAPGELAANAERYLRAPRPSMLRDYFDPALGKVVSVYRKNRVVRVQFVIEQTDMPAQ